jgi:hypothetical protein
MLGAGLEPACLSAYAPQTYVSAIPPPERLNLERAENLPSICACWQLALTLSHAHARNRHRRARLTMGAGEWGMEINWSVVTFLKEHEHEHDYE